MPTPSNNPLTSTHLPVGLLSDDDLVCLFGAAWLIRITLAADAPVPSWLDEAAERALGCLHDDAGRAHSEDAKRISVLRLIAAAERCFGGPAAVALESGQSGTRETATISLKPAISFDGPSARLH